MSQINLESAVGYALKGAQAALRAAMDAALREHALTVPQYVCLELLAQRPGQPNAELARGAFVTRQAMHQLLATLRASGLVDRHGRGRHEQFVLTDDGVRRLGAASGAVADVQRRMLVPLTDADRLRLHAYLTACADALLPGAERRSRAATASTGSPQRPSDAAGPGAGGRGRS